MTEESKTTSQSPVKISIQKCAIVTKSGRQFNIDPSYIVSMNIYESITQPGITGDIAFTDWSGVKEAGEIFAGDTLEFGYSTEGSEKTQSLFFAIYASAGDVPNPGENVGYAITTYQFCSRWIIDALTTQVSRSYYKKSIDFIVSDLLKACGVKGIEHIEPTKQVLENFVSPMWTPMHTIKHLLTLATSAAGDHGGYNFWTDFNSEKIYCMPVNMLFEGTLAFPDPAKPYTNRPHNMMYKNAIHSHMVEADFDVVQMVNSGLGKSNIVGFDYDRMDWISTNKRIQDYPHSHLGNRLPLNEEFTADKYASTHFGPYYPSTASQIPHVNKHKELLDARLKNHYTFLFSDIIKMNLHVTADSSRRAGDLIHLVHDVPFGMDRQNGSKMYTGTYMIRDIRHIISFGNYSQAITICGDGYKEINRTDLVKWQNA